MFIYCPCVYTDWDPVVWLEWKGKGGLKMEATFLKEAGIQSTYILFDLPCTSINYASAGI